MCAFRIKYGAFYDIALRCAEAAAIADAIDDEVLSGVAKACMMVAAAKMGMSNYDRDQLLKIVARDIDCNILRRKLANEQARRQRKLIANDNGKSGAVPLQAGVKEWAKAPFRPARRRSSRSAPRAKG